MELHSSFRHVTSQRITVEHVPIDVLVLWLILWKLIQPFSLGENYNIAEILFISLSSWKFAKQ